MNIRPANPEDLPGLAALWHETWTEAHAAHVDPALTELRTFDSFLERLKEYGDGVRMVGTTDTPDGFYISVGSELDQIFVSPKARGSGIAAKLIKHAECRIKSRGHDEAYLYCIAQNKRAASFYEKHGWRATGPELVTVDTSQGPFQMECLIFRKKL